MSINLADFSERAGIARMSSILRRVLKRELSLAADERAERENTGFAGIDRIRSSYYHRLNISRRYEREREKKDAKKCDRIAEGTTCLLRTDVDMPDE